MLRDFARRYPLICVEDACCEDDWASWAAVTKSVGHLQLVGDDLFATQPERILRGKATGIATTNLRGLPPKRRNDFRCGIHGHQGKCRDFR